MVKWLSILFCSLSFSSVFAAAASQIQLTEGKDYTLLNAPVQKTVEPKGKVNVKEFFNYACIHCKDIEPLVEQSLINDKTVDLNKIHVVWGDQPEIAGFAKLNATIQALSMQQLNVPAFNAIFSGQNLNDQDTLKKFLAQNGLKPADVSKFMTTYNSFTISSKVGEYKNLTTSYNIQGTPMFIVADKYVASPALPPRLIQVVQALIEKAKKESAGKK